MKPMCYFRLPMNIDTNLNTYTFISPDICIEPYFGAFGVEIDMEAIPFIV
jgi:hypothetical protein